MMDPLLALSFGNISSRDAGKIRKGLRQIEGLLAQICLSHSSGSGNRRASEVPKSDTKTKELAKLCDDPAFLEFYRLQDGFECNVATHLITCLERLLSMPSNSSNDMLLVSALNLLQGMLLLHPPSRTLFSREIYLNLLLDLLPPSFPPVVQSCTLATLILALSDNPTNTRVFESVDGLLAVSAMLSEPETTRSVKKAVLEFLYFYLLPEEPANLNSRTGGGNYMTDTARRVGDQRQRGGSAGSSSSSTGFGSGEWSDVSELDGRSLRKTPKEKRKLLEKYLNSTEELSGEFKTNQIFAGAVG